MRDCVLAANSAHGSDTYEEDQALRREASMAEVQKYSHKRAPTGYAPATSVSMTEKWGYNLDLLASRMGSSFEIGRDRSGGRECKS